MTDPEVARLRRLRGEALRVRELASALRTSRTIDEALLSRSACASWRLARVVSGRLKAHPYSQYQKDIGVGSLVRYRLAAAYTAMTNKDRISSLKQLESELRALERQLHDTRSLSWSSDFSDTLGRSQYEFESLLEDLARITESVAPATERKAARAPITESLVGNLTANSRGDWPYLAF